MSKPVTNMCVYQVRSGANDEFESLLTKHWQTLRDVELVTDEAPQIFRGANDDGSPFYVEIFTWRDDKCPDTAHELPEVMALWEPMGALCEERGGKPAMEFPIVEPIS